MKRFKIKKEKNKLIAQVSNLDEGVYFDKNYLEVDKILANTNVFPVIHPRQAKNVVDTWRERCIDIL